MAMDSLKGVVEALIFASDEPIPSRQIQDIVEDATPSQIRKAIESLNLEYKQSSRAFQIVEVAGGYQMVTREAYSQWLRRLFQKKIKSRLSQAALETLAVIAFRQPVSRTEVDAIRGVNSDGVVRTLLERKLITLSGRGEGPGRPLLYKTTKEFLRYFGINDISDLPKPREIEELLKEEKRPEEEAASGISAKPDSDANAPKSGNAAENPSPVQDATTPPPTETESTDDHAA
jgi:segregation and condensation protein B